MCGRMRPAALLLILGLVSAPAAQRSPEPFVPVGVWYAGDTAADRESTDPTATAGEDLATIRSLGFNTITVPVDWVSVEPQPGQYRLTPLERLLARAERAELKVILQLQTDPAPEWLGARHPDASAVTEAGERIPGVSCVDHPGVREDLGAFIHAVAARASGFAAFHAADVWGDPRAVPRGLNEGGADACFCPHTLRRFRRWLMAQYGTLGEVNRAWSRSFKAWDDVGAAGSTDSPTSAERQDWRGFLAQQLQEDLQFRVQASAARGARPVSSHVRSPAVLREAGPAADGPDDWRLASAVDHIGTWIYPAAADRSTAWSAAQLAVALDGIRSAAGDRGWWGSRLQAGQAVDGKRQGAPVDAADLRLWGWAAIARGARAIAYDGWDQREPIRDAAAALTAPGGSVSDRARAAGQVAGVIARNPRLFAPLRPRPARVAILYEPRAYTSRGAAAADRAIRSAMLGFHRAMFERNIPTDFLHVEELMTGRATQYALLFVGGARGLRAAAANALKAYVHAGGTLVAESGPGRPEERAGAAPGGHLDELFGAREKTGPGMTPVPMIGATDLDGPLAPLARKPIAAGSVAAPLEVTNPRTRVLARVPSVRGGPGDPALVMSRNGAGVAVLAASSPAAAFDGDPDGARSGGELLGGLAALAGVEPEVRIHPAGAAEARFLESRSALLFIAINHADEPREVTMMFPPEIPEAIWQNMETGNAVHFVAGAHGPTHTHRFAPRDVLVLMIKTDLR